MRSGVHAMKMSHKSYSRHISPSSHPSHSIHREGQHHRPGGRHIIRSLPQKPNWYSIHQTIIIHCAHKNPLSCPSFPGVPFLIVDKHNLTGLWDKKNHTLTTTTGGTNPTTGATPTPVGGGNSENANSPPIINRPPQLNDPTGFLESEAESLLDKPNATFGQTAATPAVQRIVVTVDRTRTFQPIVGFGGAFTGSVSYLLQQASSPLADQLYRMYYSASEGIGYTMMRIPIGGCDFDLAPWAYNEQPEHDAQLSGFQQLDHRDLERNAQLRRLAAVTGNADVKLVGSAWSPPRWMKTNGAWSGFGLLRPEYYRTWAEYHVRYLELQAAEAMPFWAITTGNEPLNGVIGWVFVHFMALGWTAAKQGVWVGDHMGPVLRGAGAEVTDVKLLAGDDQRYVMPWWFEKMHEAHNRSLEYLDGFAVHWYWDKVAPASLLDKTHANWPGKLILNTESCLGDKPYQTHGPLLGSWERAEEYVRAYMEDLQHSVNGWIDWNLVLDESGGPNYTNNTVDAPVIMNLGE